jgi:hypothetical protein
VAADSATASAGAGVAAAATRAAMPDTLQTIPATSACSSPCALAPLRREGVGANARTRSRKLHGRGPAGHRPHPSRPGTAASRAPAD